MRIVIIIVFGILSYLLVFLPGYFLFVLEDGEESVVTETLAELFNSSSESKLPETMPITNPGDAPPPK